MIRQLLVAAVIAISALAALAGGFESFSAGCRKPIGISVTGENVTVVDASSGIALTGKPRRTLEPLDVQGRPSAAGSDEKGQTLIVSGDRQSGFTASFYAGSRKLKSVKLMASSPLVSVIDASSRNEIIWIVQQDPPLAALFGSDGVQLARADLKEVAKAPFSVAIGPSGGGFITDPAGHGVIELTPFGVYKATHRLAGSGFTRPAGIAADQEGRFWIGDTVLGEVAPFTLSDKVLSMATGFQPLKIEDPLRLAVDSGRLWVLQGWSARLAVTDIR